VLCQIELLAYGKSVESALLRLAMQCALAVKRTELLHLQTRWRVGLVLLRHVVLALALGARQCDSFSWHLSPD
jgi:hypothetical protein